MEYILYRSSEEFESFSSDNSDQFINDINKIVNKRKKRKNSNLLTLPQAAPGLPVRRTSLKFQDDVSDC